MAKIMDPYCLHSLFWDIGPLSWALLEVQVELPISFLEVSDTIIVVFGSWDEDTGR